MVRELHSVYSHIYILCVVFFFTRSYRKVIIFKQIYLFLKDITTPHQSGSGSNGNEEIIRHNPKLQNLSLNMKPSIIRTTPFFGGREVIYLPGISRVWPKKRFSLLVQCHYRTIQHSKTFGDLHCEMVTISGIGHRDSSSNPGRNGGVLVV